MSTWQCTVGKSTLASSIHAALPRKPTVDLCIECTEASTPKDGGKDKVWIQAWLTPNSMTTIKSLGSPLGIPSPSNEEVVVMTQ